MSGAAPVGSAPFGAPFQKNMEDLENPMTSGMTLRLELFVNDIATSVSFYTRVLNFRLTGQKGDGYTPITNGEVVLGLGRLASLPDTHPVQSTAHERPGRGVEIVLEVDDIDALYAHVQAQSWPISSPLQRQSWGLRDFRLVDPDGYYLRLTSRSEQ